MTAQALPSYALVLSFRRSLASAVSSQGWLFSDLAHFSMDRSTEFSELS